MTAEQPDISSAELLGNTLASRVSTLLDKAIEDAGPGPGPGHPSHQPGGGHQFQDGLPLLGYSADRPTDVYKQWHVLK